jgi:hypothetical protein
MLEPVVLELRRDSMLGEHCGVGCWEARARGL